MTPDARYSSLIQVRCVCGRTLRAKPDQVGTDIRCWDCQRLVTVEVPREKQKVARELSDGLLGVIQGKGLRTVLLAAAIITPAFCIPRYGILVAAVVMTFGAAFYGEVIRRVSRVVRDEVEPNWWATPVPRSIVKPVLWALMSAGTVIPLWWLNAGPGQSPHWTRLGIEIAAAAWVVLPIAMLCAYASDRHGRLGIKKCLGLLLRHPFATTMALLVVPATLALIEGGLGLVFYLQRHLTFFALEFMPYPGEFELIDGVPHFFSVDFRVFAPTRFIEAYFSGLKHGYSFAAAIPASLSIPTMTGLNPTIINLTPFFYWLSRFLMTLVISTCLITGFGVQAMWLGSIVAVQKKRPA